MKKSAICGSKRGTSSRNSKSSVNLPEQQDDVYPLVVTDQFYTSVQLSYQLLRRNVYSIGTIMGAKVGYPQ
ncbi:hypothetical protein PHMEG_0003124 [Phytophthora megakarya]|uniref:PiggyBac transposable element-derived protein domain-containing protein n=1 Tax=Phytophthora megakarya TaxID=4795 RepID=A0A225WX26_9STRA|nr:hypothetical protein PHMEG_0003124 [Phytophthora megakarya]